jgi:hypothetical protein
MRITKEEFVEAMKGIEKQILIDLKNNQAFSVILEHDLVTNMTNKLYDVLINLLMKLTDDTDKWIEYFIYGLDFGKENWRLKVYDNNKKEIPLRTIEDLWNILNR